ncbi:hypothetical protein TSOC_013806 [Tetrabaena socialis]|uniref:Uncharacterized protein n=1 Tax=Tetrabaena socialis TaxID=47790 RepID=A0A2J7ZJD1_9CHLO|nr:hypothetical protein TSOC_013806 [Tetrabaena socialis]|eukprot:PNH00373.1 hypothetical protein TSOC_013806 [Tetrabaena socialis]
MSSATLSTKWNDGLRFKRKEYFQPTNHLLLRAKWNLDMQLPDVEGHLGGAEGSLQVPVDVEYGSLDLSVTQLDWICDLDGIKDVRQNPLAWFTRKKAAPRPAPGLPQPPAAPAPQTAPAAIAGERIVWPWQR